jgi:hypothetical protein
VHTQFQQIRAWFARAHAATPKLVTQLERLDSLTARGLLSDEEQQRKRYLLDLYGLSPLDL